MKCLNCGANISERAYVCPYCKMLVKDSQNIKNQKDCIKNERLSKIDDYFLGVNYKSMNLENVEKLFAELTARIDSLSENFNENIKNKYEELVNRMESIDEYLQKQYPLREEIDVNAKYDLTKTRDILEMLLNQKPVLVNQAAFTLRAAIEKKLVQLNKGSALDAASEGYYFKLFQQKVDMKTAGKLSKKRSRLNWFVHSSAKHNACIKDVFNNDPEEVKKFLFEFYDSLSEYGLVCEEF